MSESKKREPGSQVTSDAGQRSEPGSEGIETASDILTKIFSDGSGWL